ncbi:thiamine phosphate synthase [Paracerasibacillus soli]|uniref:Thiamine phosphate synthase n=1 Tax=Paracerasibacillus soli TaxID=480284 RepID=A0ABU5CV59_9BACI|nr:thiamine phosphate synthase [Virgibacillus soli]MDY0410265.1 thiamine phosphate synthase [Virgibacillus soli]
MCAIKHRLRKYLIMGSQDCHRDPKDILTEAIAAGITAFQYREKGPGSLRGDHQVELGRQLRKACYEHDILFIVNDDVHLAKLLDADGLHIGQNDISVEKARTLFPNKIIGLSVSNTTEVDQVPCI